MKNTVSQWLAGVHDFRTREALRTILGGVAGRLSSQATAAAGLVINAGGATIAKIGATAFQGVANGVPVAIAAGTAMPALTGINTTAAGQWVIACFFVDSAGSLTAVGGAPAASLAAATFPEFPAGKALVGYLVITYGAGAFAGGTTPLDTATTVYVSPVGAFDPNIAIS